MASLTQPAFMDHQVTPSGTSWYLIQCSFCTTNLCRLNKYELIIMTYQSRASFHFLDSSAPFVKPPFPKMDHSITVQGLVATWLPDHVLQWMTGIALSQLSMQVYQNLKIAEQDLIITVYRAAWFNMCRQVHYIIQTRH